MGLVFPSCQHARLTQLVLHECGRHEVCAATADRAAGALVRRSCGTPYPMHPHAWVHSTACTARTSTQATCHAVANAQACPLERLAACQEWLPLLLLPEEDAGVAGAVADRQDCLLPQGSLPAHGHAQQPCDGLRQLLLEAVAQHIYMAVRGRQTAW